MAQTVRLARIWGIDIGIHYTWLISFGLITWTLAAAVFPSEYPYWPRILVMGVSVVTSLLFFASVLLHELGHSWQALRRGIPVADITLFVFGGAARITKEAETPRDEFMVAAAGPAVSLILAAIFFGIYSLLPPPGPLAVLGTISPLDPVRAVAGWLARVNLVLAVFNLVPGFPLDGGRILRAVVWASTDNFRRATRIASRSGQVVAYFLIGIGVLTAFQGVLVSGIWLMFIGWFLLNAAESSYRQAEVQHHLQGVEARRLMRSEFLALPGSTAVDTMVNKHILQEDHRYALVIDEGRLRGIVTLTDIRGVDEDRRAETDLAAIMTPFPLATAAPDMPATAVINLLGARGLRVAPVMEGGTVIGVIEREDIIRYLHLRQELQSG